MLAMIMLFMVPYDIVNHLPFARHTIGFLWSEDRIPFMQWTFLIYISVYLQSLLVMRSMTKRFLKQALPIVAGMIAVALIGFILFPIQYPRELYTSGNQLIGLLRFVDGPSNCFPSLHVATTIFFAACYGMLTKSAQKRALMWLWSAAIIVSVLTTKQHYLIDIFGGIALATVCIYFFKRRVLSNKVYSKL